MIKLKLRCPKCGKHREWLSYKIKRREEVYGRKAECFSCGAMFLIRGNRADSIAKEIEFNAR